MGAVALGFAVLVAGCGRVGFGIPGADANEGSPQRGLILWLRMDDPIADRIASDSSGNGNDAACVAAMPCPTESIGHSGGALAGWVASDGLEVVDGPQWRLDAFTISAWIRISAIGTFSSVVGKSVGSTTDNSFQLEVRDTGQLACATFGGTTNRALAPGSVPQSTWVHVACKYTGSDVTLYQDGVVVAGPVPSTSIRYDAQSVNVGSDRNAGSPANAFDGDIDELRIYDVALSDAEIMALAR